MPVGQTMTEPSLVRLQGTTARSPASGGSRNATSPFARLLAAQSESAQQLSQAGSPSLVGPHQATSPPANAALEKAFTDFVGQTFYGQMLHAMRSSLGKPAYLHGGQAEEIFQGQLDQVLAEKMSDQTGEQFAKPMFTQQFSS